MTREMKSQIVFSKAFLNFQTMPEMCFDIYCSPQVYDSDEDEDEEDEDEEDEDEEDEDGEDEEDEEDEGELDEDDW
jgi:hypothetical protein